MSEIEREKRGERMRDTRKKQRGTINNYHVVPRSDAYGALV